MTDKQSKKEDFSRRNFLKGAGAAGAVAVAAGAVLNSPRTASADTGVDTGKMKAGVYYGRHDMRCAEIPRPVANPEGLILKVKACGICHILDKNAWEYSGSGHVGIARGHEWSGEIVEVGSEHTDFKAGDRIYMEPVYHPCFNCAACKVRDYWRCVNPLAGEAGNARHGAFAEYLQIPFATKESAILLPKSLGLSFQDLALIEPLALGVGIARRVETEKVVAVVGQDVLGLGAVASLKRRGVPKVIASDISKIRRTASEQAGADIVVDSLKNDVVQAVMDETWGLGADAVIQCDDRPTTIFQAMNMVKNGGQIWTSSMMGGLIKPNVDIGSKAGGVPMEGRAVNEPLIAFDPAAMIYSGFSFGHRLSRFQEAVEIMQSGKCTANQLVTQVFPLEKIQEAFKISRDPHESIRVMIEP
jgi:L-iditol 2-dehydrogenase